MPDHPLPIALAHLRRFLVCHQGLTGEAFHGPSGILAYIAQAGCIQYDPLNVVGRNHELVLQARIHDFRPQDLQALLYETHQLLDLWDKNMAIVSCADWPAFARQRLAARRRYDRPGQPAAAIFAEVREAITRQGPLCSAQIGHDRQVDWSWAPTRLSRAALESLYFCGELVVAAKKGTRRYYDLASRHLPPAVLDAPDPHPGEAAYDDWYVERRIDAIGALWNRPGGAWLGISGFSRSRREAAFDRLQAAGRILPLSVPELIHPVFIRSTSLPLLDSTATQKIRAAAILAPLDNLLWDRALTAAIFGFDYRWEVYKPARERQYGYYVLPVLLDERFIARFEPAPYHAGQALEIRNWWWEAGIEPDHELNRRLQELFKRFCGFLGTDSIRLAPGLRRRTGLDLPRSVHQTPAGRPPHACRHAAGT